MTEEVRRKYERRMKGEVSSTVRRALNGAQDVVGDVLRRGVGPLGGGSRTISYTSPVTGQGRRFTTEPWNDLTKPYAKKKPISRRFWRKHFDSDTYPKDREPLIDLFEAAKQDRHVRSGRSIVVSKSEKFTLLRWNFYLTSYPNILEFIIVEPLLRATVVKGTHQNYPVSPNRAGASMLVWLEQGTRKSPARPFIAGMSSQIGQDMYGKIRKILRRP
jgi:hypothetical protein